ncbi:hypothetical protein QC760_007878 [Botrytis cinerea]
MLKGAILRLERFQRGLTQEDVGIITERFTDRGYIWYEAPRARFAGGLLAASRVHADPEVSVNSGEAEDAVMRSIVVGEELNMQDPQQQPSAQHAPSCVICSGDDAPAVDLVQPPPGDESHVQVCLACYRSSLDAQNEEHVRNVELKARNDQAQAQIDNLRNQNSNLDARPFLEVTHRQFLRESRHDLSTILNLSQSMLNEPRDYGTQFQRLHQLLMRFSEKDKTRLGGVLASFLLRGHEGRYGIDPRMGAPLPPP